MTTTSVKNARTSRIASNMRPVAQLVEDRLTLTAEDRRQREIVQATHNITRKLVKLLFSQISQSGIDHVVGLAHEAQVATKLELGVDVNFALRIRNAEIQARELLTSRVVNPEAHSVVMELKSGEEVIASELVDSWGKFAGALLKGYSIRA